jgi:hypothetical protein
MTPHRNLIEKVFDHRWRGRYGRQVVQVPAKCSPHIVDQVPSICRFRHRPLHISPVLTAYVLGELTKRHNPPTFPWKSPRPRTAIEKVMSKTGENSPRRNSRGEELDGCCRATAP